MFFQRSLVIPLSPAVHDDAVYSTRVAVQQAPSQGLNTSVIEANHYQCVQQVPDNSTAQHGIFIANWK